MDTDKKMEDDKQEIKTPVESGDSDAAPEDVAAAKRKRTEDEEVEDNQDTKKMKMEDKEETITPEPAKDEAKKEDAAEEDKDEEKETKEASLVKEEEKEVKSDEAEDKVKVEPAEKSRDSEPMEVEETAVKVEQGVEKPQDPQGPVKEEKTESVEQKDKPAEEIKAEPEPETKPEPETQPKPEIQPKPETKPELEIQPKLETKPEPETRPKPEVKPEPETQPNPETKPEPETKPDPEKEEKTDEVQPRRYPTRSRQQAAAERAVSQSVKSEAGGRGVRKTEAGESENRGASSVRSDSGGGSDKENTGDDGSAMDLSAANTPDGDLITLSEDEESEESKERRVKRRKLVRKLQAHLRNEEAKLVLLKKLRQSQLTPQVTDSAPSTPNSATPGQLPKQSLPRQQGGPPPLVRGGGTQPVRSANLHMQQQQVQSRTPTQGGMRNVQGPPPLVGTPRMGSGTPNGHGNQNLRNNTTPHSGQHSSSGGLRPQQQALHQQQKAATPPQPPVDTQTPAQRQAAAKLALRKQLEKTLLQIPPPKPPAPEMNFIPSLACPDFVLLLGLEEVVNHIIDLQLIARGQKSPDEKFICNPFTCVQCGTDYTPVWKREKPGSKNVICEHCVTWNQKRALKQEHTNRLKSAFVKALQQEQEIERMQAQTPSNPSTPTPSGTPPTTTSSSSSSSAPPQALAAAAAASNVAAAAAMSMNPSSFRPSAEQVRQHHSFLQAQAQLRAGGGLQGFGARSPFPYNLPYVKQTDLQRQYLLDMMPRSGSMPWKQ